MPISFATTISNGLSALFFYFSYKSFSRTYFQINMQLIIWLMLCIVWCNSKFTSIKLLFFVSVSVKTKNWWYYNYLGIDIDLAMPFKIFKGMYYLHSITVIRYRSVHWDYSVRMFNINSHYCAKIASITIFYLDFLTLEINNLVISDRPLYVTN